MKTCEKCGLELFAAQGKPAKTVILNSNNNEPTKLILRQYLTCRNSQCSELNKEILNVVDLQFDEETTDPE